MPMKILILILCCQLSIGVIAQMYQIKSGKIVFDSNAPQEDIHAESKSLTGLMDLTANNFAFAIDINTFKGFNSELQQEHFYENYMQTGLYPRATFTGKLIDKFTPELATQTIRAKGSLEIHGVKQERIIEVTIKKSGGNFQFESAFNVLLDDHGIAVPKLVNQKIAENIKVLVKASLIEKS
jgi:hypothetical protein